jgi:hypothetical protein
VCDRLLGSGAVCGLQCNLQHMTEALSMPFQGGFASAYEKDAEDWEMQ